MKLVSLLALVALVVSCHLDKLLNAGKTPPSQAPPARVAFSSPPSSARAGEPINPPVQVTVQDSAGHVTLRDTLVILSLGANPSGDSLRGDTVAHSVNGVATFVNVRLDKAARGYRLAAVAPELHPDTSPAFSVMPAPATVLAFTVQPTGATQGSAITPPVQVTAYDALGNTATDFTGPIRLAFGTDGSVSHSAKLLGTNPVPAVAGVATFSDLAVDQPGSGYTLAAAFGSATPGAASAAFKIPPGAPPTGSMAVTTSTSGGTPDPDGYAYSVDGATPQPIADNQTITLTGVATGSHTVVLSGLAGNCTVSGGTSRTVTVTASQTVTASFTVSCPTPPPPTGSLAVTTSTSGGTPDPDGYAYSVDGATPQPIADNQTITLTGVATGSHTVVLSGLAANCTVSGGTSRTVTVSAGQTVTASFTVSCPTPPPPTGSLAVTTSTSGATPDPDGYAYSVDGATPQPIADNQTITLTGVATGSHTVVLSGLAGNCTVSGGTSRTVTVTAGQTVTASYTISCPTPPPPTGSLAVTTSTSGATPDPDGYAYSVDGATPQPIADNQTITLTGVATGSHTVVLSGLAANCTVSGGTSRTVTVTAAQTVTASYTISCPTPPPPNVAPVVNAGSDDHALTGLLYSFSWSFSDGNHNGPWSYRIDWGDGQTSTGNVSTEGTLSSGHTYIIVLPRSFTITVTVTDASGASGSDSKVVSVTLL